MELLKLNILKQLVEEPIMLFYRTVKNVLKRKFNKKRKKECKYLKFNYLRSVSLTLILPFVVFSLICESFTYPVDSSELSTLSEFEAGYNVTAAVARKSLTTKSKEMLKPHQRAQDKGVKHAGLARDLHAEPLIVLGELRLNVSWLPTKGRKPNEYSIEVHPLNITGCESKLCYEHSINASSLWSLIPGRYSSVEGDECSIKPGCSYRIQLTSSPWNGKDILTTEVSLPGCIGSVCACNSSPSIIAPSLEVDVQNNSINVTWLYNRSMQLDSHQQSQFILSLGEQKVSSPTIKPWYGHDKVVIVSAQEFGLYRKAIRANITKGKSYLVRVQIVNNGCTGPVGNFTIKVPEDDPAFYEKNYNLKLWIMAVALPLVVFLMIYLAGGCRLICRIKQFLRSRTLASRTSGVVALHRQPAWPPNCMQVTENVSIGADLRHETSPLYVEKEIFDARVRGEADEWEVSPQRMTLGQEVGEGAFGRVYLAKVDLPGHQVVAVKKLKSRAAPEEVAEFLGEIAMLKLVGQHPNVVALLGCCTLRQPYCALLEYAPGGDLLKHLKALREAWKQEMNAVTSGGSLSSYVLTGMQAEVRDRPSVAETEYTMLGSENTSQLGCKSLGDENTNSSIGSDAFTDSSGSLTMQREAFTPARNPTVGLVLTSKTLHNYALQISLGMEHLESKGITHRDLAARNVLVDAKGALKVSDLGLSRPGVYAPSQRARRVPLRWLALESLLHSNYSNKSDVWSYAVLLWEIGTLGGFPYPNLGDHQILQYLMDNKRLDKPEVISQDLYSTMLKCWNEDPNLRPSFSELVNILDEKSERNAYVDISNLQSSYVFPPTEEASNLKMKADDESRSLLKGNTVV